VWPASFKIFCTSHCNFSGWFSVISFTHTPLSSSVVGIVPSRVALSAYLYLKKEAESSDADRLVLIAGAYPSVTSMRSDRSMSSGVARKPAFTGRVNFVTPILTIASISSFFVLRAEKDENDLLW
jgi:hypothetical protein